MILAHHIDATFGDAALNIPAVICEFHAPALELAQPVLQYRANIRRVQLPKLHHDMAWYSIRSLHKVSVTATVVSS